MTRQEIKEISRGEKSRFAGCTYSCVLSGLLGKSLLQVVAKLNYGAGSASHATLGDEGGDLY